MYFLRIIWIDARILCRLALSSCQRLLDLPIKMPLSSKPLKNTMPESDEEVQGLVEEKLGVRPCLWQIKVVRKILAQDDVITIAATGSRKSLTSRMPSSA